MRQNITGGIVLILFGAVLLLQNMGFWAWLNWRTMWPIFLIGAGVAMLFRQKD